MTNATEQMYNKSENSSILKGCLLVVHKALHLTGPSSIVAHGRELVLMGTQVKCYPGMVLVGCRVSVAQHKS